MIDIKKDDKLVSINGQEVYQYRVKRKRTEVTEWYVESADELTHSNLRFAVEWRERTGGNKDFPYGAVTMGKQPVDVGHGSPQIDKDDRGEWEFNKLNTEYEDE